MHDPQMLSNLSSCYFIIWRFQTEWSKFLDNRSSVSLFSKQAKDHSRLFLLLFKEDILFKISLQLVGYLSSTIICCVLKQE